MLLHVCWLEQKTGNRLPHVNHNFNRWWCCVYRSNFLLFFFFKSPTHTQKNPHSCLGTLNRSSGGSHPISPTTILWCTVLHLPTKWKVFLKMKGSWINEWSLYCVLSITHYRAVKQTIVWMIAIQLHKHFFMIMSLCQWLITKSAYSWDALCTLTEMVQWHTGWVSKSTN